MKLKILAASAAVLTPADTTQRFHLADSVGDLDDDPSIAAEACGRHRIRPLFDSRRIAISNSANAPTICIIIRPDAVVAINRFRQAPKTGFGFLNAFRDHQYVPGRT